MKKNNYTLGLDLGITSVGWGILDLDNAYQVVDAGVRLFDEATPKEERRLKRAGRRLKRRRQQRILDLLKLLKNHDLVDENFGPLQNPYDLRCKGLKTHLEKDELATALIHLVKRRGTSLDIEDFDETNADDASAKKALQANSQALKNNDMYVCQHQLERMQGTKEKVRDNENIYATEDYVSEAKRILSNQATSTEFNEAFITLLRRKRHYSDGPGNEHSPTPYGRYRLNDQGDIIKVNLIEEMIGKCSIYPDNLRAPKQSWSAELFNFLNDLNNLTISKREDNPKLTKDEKVAIINIIKMNGALKPKNNPAKAIAAILDLDEKDFSGFRIDGKDTPLITSFDGYQKILKCLKEHNISIESMPVDFFDLIDDLMVMLTKTKTMQERRQNVQPMMETYSTLHDVLTPSMIDSFLGINAVEKYHSLSLKALKELQDELLNTSLNQMQIITNKKSQEPIKNLVLSEGLILSPVAKRVHREAFKVIEALQKNYGEFNKIVIETTRDKNTKDQRDNIRIIQERNKKAKEDALSLIQDKEGQPIHLSGIKQLKLRFYQQQHGRCAYTDTPINLEALLGDDYRYEIDHIIPYSISLDNSLDNRVLVARDANQVKGNRTPYEYFMSGKALGPLKAWEHFETNVIANHNYSRRKKGNLLNVSALSKYEREGFIERNLVDTSYAIRSFMQTLRNYFDAKEMDTNVFTMRGKITALFRNRGGYEYLKAHNFKVPNPLEKNRDEFKHHAIDALIVARLAEQSLVKKLLRVELTKQVDSLTGEVKEDISPLEDQDLIVFVKKLATMTNDDFKFSWKIDTKPNRKFSDETIYSTRIKDGKEYVIAKHKNIYEMKSQDLKTKIFAEGKRESFLMYRHDRVTFDHLEAVFQQYKDEKQPFQAYVEEHGDKLRKRSHRGLGPVIKDLKYMQSALGSHLPITHKYPTPKNGKNIVLQSIKPYRFDVYLDKGNYKFVTIRRKDLTPSKNARTGKIQYSINKETYQNLMESKGINLESTLIASFHRNELIQLQEKERDGRVITQVYRVVGTNNDKSNTIEVKDLASSSTNQVKKVIGRKTLTVRKIVCNEVGICQVLNNQVLQLNL